MGGAPRRHAIRYYKCRACVAPGGDSAVRDPAQVVPHPGCKVRGRFFGTSLSGVMLSGGHCLDVLGKATGFPAKDEKSVSLAESLHVLGLVLSFVPRTLVATVSIDPAKASKWSKILVDVLSSGHCSQQTAIKMAGRLSFAVMSSTGRIGRAYIKPFFAQANAPLPRGRASEFMPQAAGWWVSYFAMKPVSAIACGGRERKVVHAWTDAAGASRWIAAIIRTEAGFFWTRSRLPDALWDQFLPRGDEQIGSQELMAIPLMAATFEDYIKDSLLSLAIDNSGVVGNMVKGSGSAADHNLAIARIWLNFAAAGVAPWFLKVETKCNVADGPTRDNFEEVLRLSARFVEPRWPDWIADIWKVAH